MAKYGNAPAYCSSGYQPSLVAKLKHQQLRYRLKSRRQIVKVHATSDKQTKQQSGWTLPWPFKPPAACDSGTEYEIVYVTDNGTEELQQEQENNEETQADGTKQQQQQQQQQHIPRAAASAADDPTHTNVLPQEQQEEAVTSTAPQNFQQVAPEAAVAAAITSPPLPAAEAVEAPSSNAAAVQTPTTTHTTADSSTSHSSSNGMIVTPSSSSPLAAAAAVSSGSGFWQSSVGGWVVAAALLLAVREGRVKSDADRTDVRALQARQENNRVQSQELRARRAQYLQQQQAMKEAAAARRLADSARRAEAERQQAAAAAAEYERVARQELEALRARRAAAKKAFEESAAQLDEELKARTARELALREEELARREEQQKQQRAAAAAEAARLAAEAQRAAAAAEQAAREAAERRAADKKMRRQNSTRLTIELTGQVTAAPVAAATDSNSNRKLNVLVQLYPGTFTPSSSSSSIGSSSKNIDSPDSAVEGATGLVAAAATAAVQYYTSATAAAAGDHQSHTPPGLAVVQPEQQGSSTAATDTSSSSSSSSSSLSAADADLWRMLFFTRVESSARLAVCQVAPLAGSGELCQEFKVYHRYSALPAQHPSSLQQQLAAAAESVAADNLKTAVEILQDVIEWQLEDYAAVRASDTFDFGSSSSSSSSDSGSSNSLRALVEEATNAAAAAGSSTPVSLYLVPVCVFAVLLNLYDQETIQYNTQRSSSSSSGGGGGGGGGRPDSPDSDQAGSSSSSSTPMDTAGDDYLVSHEPAPGISQQNDVYTTSAATSSSSSGARQKGSSSSSGLQRLVKFQLEEITKGAPPDSLEPLAAAVKCLLGPGHPVAAALLLLSAGNISVATRQSREVRRQQQQLAAATQLLQGSAIMSGPGSGAAVGLDPQGARLRQQLVPAPERIWALRNVANNMIRTAAAAAAGGSSAADEAVGMLKQAADLAAAHYGPRHPGQLSALLDYISALLTVPGHSAEAAAAIETACDVVAAVGDRYRQQHDLLSLVLLYEATQAELDVPELIGRNNSSSMVRLQRQAADAFSVLDTQQANLVMSKRQLIPGSPSTALRQLARDCTEQLGVYSSSSRRTSRLDQWNKNQPLTPLR